MENVILSLATIIAKQEREIERLRLACAKANDEVCQTLGNVLGYPWFADDQKNFPGATTDDGVCVGDHSAQSLAMEAAAEIERLRALNADMQEAGYGT